MSDLRTAAQQALDDLKDLQANHNITYAGTISRLEAALAQEQAEPDAYGYASYLAVAIWEKHYKGVAPNWKPLDDLAGVLTQIDNMTAGLTRRQAEPVQEQAEPVQEPVAWVWGEGFVTADRRAAELLAELGHEVTPLYIASPQAEPVQEQAEPVQANCALAELREKVGLAYGYLWCVNNEPGAPHQMPPERMAYEARKLLRDTMTHHERGEFINRVLPLVRGVGAELARAAPPQREPLTDEEIDRIWRDGGWAGRHSIGLIRAVERALEEKNRGR